MEKKNGGLKLNYERKEESKLYHELSSQLEIFVGIFISRGDKVWRETSGKKDFYLGKGRKLYGKGKLVLFFVIKARESKK